MFLWYAFLLIFKKYLRSTKYFVLPYSIDVVLNGYNCYLRARLFLVSMVKDTIYIEFFSSFFILKRHIWYNTHLYLLSIWFSINYRYQLWRRIRDENILKCRIMYKICEIFICTMLLYEVNDRITGDDCDNLPYTGKLNQCQKYYSASVLCRLVISKHGTIHIVKIIFVVWGSA